MIVRQLTYRRNIDRDLKKYGVEGTVKLCCARAYGLYMLLTGAIGASLAIAGEPVLAVPAFVIVWLLAFLSVARSVSAARTGERWRSTG